MSFRTFESPMDWEYQDRGQRSAGCPSPFAKTAGSASFGPGSPADNRNTMRPFKPQVSFAAINPQHKAPQASPFRNPAFTTPQKRVDAVVMSDFSGAESSPALTDDASSMPADTPDTDRTGKFGQMTITPATMKRSLFGKSDRSAGAGEGDIHSRLARRVEQVRGKRESARKRKRQTTDNDIGAARRRLPYEPDDDSDWDSDVTDGGAKKKKKGWVSNFLSVVSNHPKAPAILSEWLRLVVNAVLIGVIVYGIFSMVVMVRNDLSFASEKERTRLAEEIAKCSQLYLRNHCEPQSRVPHMEVACDEWESCMGQDVEAVMKTRVSARNAAEILNEFVGTVTYKTWLFVLSVLLIGVISSRIGFGYTSEIAAAPVRPTTPYPSQSAVPPFFHPQDGNQAYILAPFATPRRLPRPSGDVSDTDDSPVDSDPWTFTSQLSSQHRSPSKGQRTRSPSKEERGRSPAKGVRTPLSKSRHMREPTEF